MSAEIQKNQGLLDAALEIQAQRSQTLREIKRLIMAGDESQAMRLMKKFFGIHDRKFKLVK